MMILRKQGQGLGEGSGLTLRHPPFPVDKSKKMSEAISLLHLFYEINVNFP